MTDKDIEILRERLSKADNLRRCIGEYEARLSQLRKAFVAPCSAPYPHTGIPLESATWERLRLPADDLQFCDDLKKEVIRRYEEQLSKYRRELSDL